MMLDPWRLGKHTPYYEWLLDIVGGEEWCRDIDGNLMALFERRYYHKDPLDCVYHGHAEELRAEAFADGVREDSPPEGEARVLEVLVILAIDADKLLQSSSRGQSIPRWFSDIVKKLGLDCEIDYIDQAIDDFLSGKTKLVEQGGTLWSQVNMLYYEMFMDESDQC